MPPDPENGPAEDDGEGKSYREPVFAFRCSKTPATTGQTSYHVELKEKHIKYLTAAETRPLPNYGPEGEAAKDGYLEFLEGLDLINQSEPLDVGYTEVQAWERLMRRRANTRTQRLFDDNLLRRAKIHKQTKPEACRPLETPIQDMTRTLLTRTPEEDYTQMGVLFHLLSMASLAFAISSQINSIVQVCSAAYVCPQNEATAGLPIVAPPVRFRNLSQTGYIQGSTFYPNITIADSAVKTFKTAEWYPTVEESCKYGESGCDTPGYQVQWPYMQSSVNQASCGNGKTRYVCSGDDWRACNVSTTGKCHFPFIYQQKVFTSCTDIDSSSGDRWCSLTLDYDKDKMWGHCTACRGENVPLEKTLVDQCKVVREGPDRFVWDPFLEDIREEYLDCRKNGKLPEHMPFQQDVEVVDENVLLVSGANTSVAGFRVRKSPFHFLPAYYEDLHARTLECMDDWIADENTAGKSCEGLDLDEAACNAIGCCSYDASKPSATACRASAERDAVCTTLEDRLWPPNLETSVKTKNVKFKRDYLLRARGRQFMRSCMASKAQGSGVSGFFTPGIRDSDRCGCDQRKYAAWAVQTFFFNKDQPTQRCSSGKLQGRLCTKSDRGGAADICKNGDENSEHVCEVTFPDQNPISMSAKYGCFFSHPGAEAPLDPTYHQCGWETIERPRSVDDEDQKYQRAINVHLSGMSKRSAILILFLIKEGGPVTALTIFLLLFVIGGVLFGLLWFLLIFLPKMCRDVPALVSKDPAKEAATTQLLIGIWLALYDNLRVIFLLCLNLSSTYRLFQFANQLRLQKVNVSIKDMEQKVTSLATTIFNLGVIALTGTPDSLLLASTAMTLLLLARTMCNEQYRLQHIAAGLHDLNQNRLSAFETALLWVKIMEDVLDDDIMFNWVQHFRTQEPLRPEVVDHSMESISAANESQAQAHHGENLDEMILETEEEIANAFNYLKGRGVEMLREQYMEKNQNQDTSSPLDDDEMRDLLFMPLLTSTDAEMFGSDGKGCIATLSMGGLSSAIEHQPATTYPQALQSSFAVEDKTATFVLTEDGKSKLDAWVANGDADEKEYRRELVENIKKNWRQDADTSKRYHAARLGTMPQAQALAATQPLPPPGAEAGLDPDGVSVAVEEDGQA